MRRESIGTLLRFIGGRDIGVRTIEQVAAEFTVFKSAASGKVDSKSNLAAMLTSVVHQRSLSKYHLMVRWKPVRKRRYGAKVKLVRELVGAGGVPPIMPGAILDR